MADHIDENSPAPENSPGPENSAAPEQQAEQTPQPDPAQLPSDGGDPQAPARAETGAETQTVTTQTGTDPDDEEADGEAEAAAALIGGPSEPASPVEELAAPPVDEPELPRFGAQFSSPEPTTVTARPRRRATRPALSADADSVESPNAPAAPPLPAFLTFVAPEAEVAAPRRRSRRPEAESPAEPEQQTREDASQNPDAPAPRRGRRARAQSPVEPAQPEEPSSEDRDHEDSGRETEAAAPRRSRSRQRAAAPNATVEDGGPVDEAAVDVTDTDVSAADVEDLDDRDAEDSGSIGSRRRRRGRRGRGRGRPGDDGAETDVDDTDTDSVGDEEEADSAVAGAEGEDDAESEDAESAGGSSTRRRRRRRRRGESSTEDAVEEPDDRPERAGRNGRISSDDDVRGVAGSTRLEAKRQRRRDGRDGGRRRAPILSESEFLARREAVDRAMVIRQQGERTQIAVLEDDVLVEHYVTQAQSASFAGNVYLGRVQNVLPSMEAAFVDVGKGRNAVLYAGEVNWDAAGLSGKSRSIEQALKSGDKVLVQVTKDPIGHKGARLTQQINLPGRFLVYVPGGSMTGISRKLPDKERTRLKDILKKIVPDDAGVIIRTAAEGATAEELTRDVARLQAQWEVISTKAASTSNAPTLLYGEPDLAIRVIRDVFNEDFKRLVVQGDDAWDTVEAYVAHVSPELSERVQRYTGTGDVFSDLRIDEQLMKALDRKVWLPSGGSLVIDRTEAMTVVDVNTGKFVGSGGNLEQTVTRNNIEAAEEIVRQLRLRDIGGMIVIDFIDMVLESNRDLVLRRLTECLGRDRTKHQVAEVTSLGLVQMTRKRVGQGLLEVFSEPCEHCRGRGVLVHLDPVDEKRRAGNGGGGFGGNGPAGSGNGNGNGGNGSGRHRDQQRSGRDAGPGGSSSGGSDSSGSDSSGGAGDHSQRHDLEQPSGGTDAGAEPAVDADSGGPDETPAEGRGGRRSRGRRGRGQSGEARAAEDAAVLAGTHDDAAEPELADRDDVALPAPTAVEPAELAFPELPELEPVAARPRRRRAASRPAGPPA